MPGKAGRQHRKWQQWLRLQPLAEEEAGLPEAAGALALQALALALALALARGVGPTARRTSARARKAASRLEV